MPSRLLLVFSISSLLLLSLITTSPTLTRASTSTYKSKAPPAVDDDDDLSFLEKADDDKHSPSKSDQHYSDDESYDDDDEDFDNYDDFELPEALDAEENYSNAQVDDKDVVVLTSKNFSDFIDSNKYVMVEFFAPWCGHCQALAPEYAKSATELKEEKVALAKVDATEENKLAEEYEVQGFPTVYFFNDGDHKPYIGQRTKDAIVTWIKKKIGPGIYNISTLQDAERKLTSENRAVLGFLDSLEGPDSEELAAASKLEDDVNFYQTTNPDVAKLFHMDSNVKRPTLVMLKKEAEKVCHYEGQFTKARISEFVSANKLPLVTIFTRESAPLIFDSPIKEQLLLFATSNDSDNVVQVFQEASKHFKGKIIFVYVQIDNEDVGQPVSDYFGVTGDVPKVLAYRGNDDSRKYFFDGEVTISNIKAFGEDFLEDKLKPFYKSDPIPQTNDGDVKIVVGNNFDEVVLDESKDVLLEIYAPWCGHCQALEPTYNKLAKHLHGIESLIIAKMDGTTNEHPRAQADGFPTLLFFPAGKKRIYPITVDADRTVVALYKFIRKHASVPFKLQKPVTSPNSESSDDEGSIGKSTDDVKDEF